MVTGLNRWCWVCRQVMKIGFIVFFLKQDKHSRTGSSTQRHSMRCCGCWEKLFYKSSVCAMISITSSRVCTSRLEMKLTFSHSKAFFFCLMRQLNDRVLPYLWLARKSIFCDGLPSKHECCAFRFWGSHSAWRYLCPKLVDNNLLYLERKISLYLYVKSPTKV